jgi:hypothetical protein
MFPEPATFLQLVIYFLMSSTTFMAATTTCNKCSTLFLKTAFQKNIFYIQFITIRKEFKHISKSTESYEDVTK